MSRPASDEEQAVVAWLLANAAQRDGAEELRSQVAALCVVAGCDCGCASVDFAPAVTGVRSAVVAEATGQDPAGTLVGAMVRAGGGRISSLEVYVLGEGTKCALPRLETLKKW